MTTTSSDRNVELSVSLNPSEFQNVLSSLVSIKDNLTSIGGTAAQQSDIVKDLSENITNLDREKRIQQIVTDFHALGEATGNTKETVDGLVSALEQVGASKAEIDAATASLEKMNAQQEQGGNGPGLGEARRFGSVLGGLGVTGAAQDFRTAFELSESVKIVGELTEKIGGLGEVIGPVIGSLAPITIALGAAFLLVKSAMSETQATAAETVKRIEDYNKDIFTLTTDAANKQLDSLQKQKEAQDKTYTDLTDKAKSIDFSHVLDFLTQVESSGPSLAAALTQQSEYTAGADKAKKSSADLTAQIDALKEATSGDALAANDAAAAEIKLAAARDKAADDSVTRIENDAKLIATSSAKSIEDQIKGEETKQAAIKQTLDENLKLTGGVQSLGDAFGLSKDEIKKLQDEYYASTILVKDLKDNVLGLVEARERENAVLKLTTDALAARQKELDNYLNQEDALYAKHETEVSAIQAQGIQERTALETKYQDALVQLAQQTADAAAKSLQQLQDTEEKNQETLDRGLQDLAIKQQQDEQNLRIKFQEEEVKALTDHVRKLQDIRENAAFREQDDLLNRNFLGLYKDQLQTTKDLQDENKNYQRSEEDRIRSLKESEDALDRQIAQERQAKLQAYQRANEDAQANYDKQIRDQQQAEEQKQQMLNENYQKELSALSTKITNELTLKQQAYDAEYKALADFVDKARNLLADINAPASTEDQGIQGGQYGYADGGSIAANQIGRVNDKYPGQRESFNGMMLPAGLGYFMPSVSGHISPNKQAGSSVTITNNINGVLDPVAVGNIAKEKTLEAFTEFFA